MDYEITVNSDYMLESGADCIIPVAFFVGKDIIRAECYPSLEEYIDSFLSKNSEQIEEKIGSLSDYLTNFCKNNGYNDIFGFNVKKCYICDDDTKLKIQSVVKTEELDCNSDYDSALEMGLTRAMYDGDDYPYRAVGIFEDGKLVCAACENSHYYDTNEETEIGVETAEKYRRRGYAAACTAELCRILREDGRKKIYYESDCDNIASENTAKSAGLDFYSDNYYFVAYREEN